MTANKDPGDEYLRRFRGVEPPRELRARVLEHARPRIRERWLLGVAAFVLVLLAGVNVHLAGRVQALARGGVRPDAAPPERENHPTELPESFDLPSLPWRLAVRRPPSVGEQSWLKLRAEIERTEG